MKTFDEAALAATREAVRRAGSIVKLSAQTNIRTVILAAYLSGVSVVPEGHLRAINDYLKRSV